MTEKEKTFADKCIEKIKEYKRLSKLVGDQLKIYLKLIKMIPDIRCYWQTDYGGYDNVERPFFYAESVNKEWTHTTTGGGYCGTIYFRTYRIIDGIKVYSPYKAKLGYTGENQWGEYGFHKLLDLGKAIMEFGERVRDPLLKELGEQKACWDNDDDN